MKNSDISSKEIKSEEFRMSIIKTVNLKYTTYYTK